MNLLAPARYRNLIFDLGGVLFNIDYDAPIESFRKLSGLAEPLAFNQQAQAPLFDALETGKLSVEAFRAALRSTYAIKPTVTDPMLDSAWNAILLDFPAERLTLLRTLRRSGFQLFLLSNTNALHREAFDAILYRDHGLSDGLLSLFDRVYYSHEIGLRKPDIAIFRKALTDNQLVPTETLFIDDSPQHVLAARAVGLGAIWLQPHQSLTGADSPLLHALQESAA
jgi:glucose-1-phosphatase